MIEKGSNMKTCCTSLTGMTRLGLAMFMAAVVVESGKCEAQPATADAAGRYLVIDLSPGAKAEQYPVRYLSDVPPGGWTDAHRTTNLVLRRITAGTFTMGSPSDELGRDADEIQHAVTLTKAFYLGVYEVTQKQWELVMGKREKQERLFNERVSRVDERPVDKVSYYQIREVVAAVPGKPVSPAVVAPKATPKPPKKAGKETTETDTMDDDEKPPSMETSQAQVVEKKNVKPRPAHDPQVNWPANNMVNADSFMGKLRAKTGLKNLDLPTEAQWEYACRAGATSALDAGKNLTRLDICPNLAAMGRYSDNLDPSENATYGYSIDKMSGIERTDKKFGIAVAGSYAANNWGLYDMHGNVWEWCLDWYGEYPAGAQTDPKGATYGTVRVLRGGSWEDSARMCRAANRGRGGMPGSQNGDFGFRVAMTTP
ncbi:MAG: formylglycine-generating enzyme family protein [Magnetococcus sp. WYHC-3]